MANGGVVQGELLRRARLAKGLTQAKLAEQIAELAWLRDRQHLGIGPDMVSKWERDIKHPNPTYGELLCVFFGADPATLGLAAASNAREVVGSSTQAAAYGDVPWAEVLVALGEHGHLLHRNVIEQWENDLLKRRDVLKSMGLAAIASTLTSLEPPVSRTARLGRELLPDPATLDGLATLAARYQRLYHDTTPSVLLAPIKAHLATLNDLLKSGGPARQQRILYGNHSQVAQLAGRLAFFDLRDELSARGYFMTAYDSAVAAGDSALAAAAVGHLAFVPAARGQWTAAADHLGRARTHAEAAPTIVRSWLAAVSSEIHANAGDEHSALVAIDDAKRTIQPASSALAWFDFYDATRLHGFEGYALLRSGRSAAAARHLDGALATLEPSAVKQRTVFLTDLATAHVRQGDLDKACDLAIQAVTDLTSRRYATCVDRLRDFRSSVQPYAGSRAVRNLDRAMAEL